MMLLRLCSLKMLLITNEKVIFRKSLRILSFNFNLRNKNDNKRKKFCIKYTMLLIMVNLHNIIINTRRF